MFYTTRPYTFFYFKKTWNLNTTQFGSGPKTWNFHSNVRTSILCPWQLFTVPQSLDFLLSRSIAWIIFIYVNYNVTNPILHFIWLFLFVEFYPVAVNGIIKDLKLNMIEVFLCGCIYSISTLMNCLSPAPTRSSFVSAMPTALLFSPLIKLCRNQLCQSFILNC